MIRRREFISLLGSAAGIAAWPLAARAQQVLPVIGFLRTGTFADVPKRMSAFHQGLKEVGFVEVRTSQSSTARTRAKAAGCRFWWRIFLAGR
jgi:hypothetical protein